MASLRTRVSIPEDLLFRELEGEAVLLDLDSGEYFGLDEMGTEMWLTLTRHDTLDDGYRDLLARYDVAPERLRQDLLEFVDLLLSHRLLQIAD